MTNEDQLIACAVGDGYVQIRKVLKPNGHYRIKQSVLNVVHAISQAEYCKYKWQLCRDNLGGNFEYKEYTHSPPAAKGKSYEVCRFNCSNPYWKQVHSLLYKDNKKTYTKELLDKLTLRSLAIWYMDDGHLRLQLNKCGTIASTEMNIATMCSLEEAELITSWIKDSFNVEMKIRCDKRYDDDKKFFLASSTKESKKLGELLLPEIHSSMIYKVRHIVNTYSKSAAQPEVVDDIV